MVWMDEEPEFNSLELYAQCVTRLATTDGHIMLTATPEHGNTDLNRLYDEDETGYLYLTSVGWDDCPHLDEATKANLLAGFPEWQHEMRKNGVPVLGSGAVFPFADSSLYCADVKPKPHWRVIAGIDFGIVIDPSVIMYAAHDPDEDLYYLYSETYLDNDRSPDAIAKAILSSTTPNIPVIVPDDAGLNSGAPDSKGMMLINAGVNVIREPFKNPAHLQMSIKTTASHRSAKSIEAGLEAIRKLMKDEKLKVSVSCAEWFKEKAKYMYKQKSSGKVEPSARDNHCMDASRYALLSLMGNKGAPYGQCFTSFSDFNNGFSASEESAAYTTF